MRRAAVIYAVMSHSNPDQVVRLCERIRRDVPRSPVLVRHDQRSSTLAPTALDHLEDVFLLRSPVEVRWGEFSQVEATLELFSEALRRDFTYLMLLSGQHYPLRHLSAFEERLLQQGGDGLVPARRACRPLKWGHWRREPLNDARKYKFHYFDLGSTPLVLQKAVGAVTREIEPLACIRLPHRNSTGKLGIRARNPLGGLPPFCGSTWVALSRRALEQVMARMERRPKVVEAFRHSSHADEALFHTLVWTDPELKPRNEDPTYVRWPREEFSPRVLTIDDYEALRTAPEWFARKFDISVDASILDALDEHASGQRAVSSPSHGGLD
jgi:hypothetical protein